MNAAPSRGRAEAPGSEKLLLRVASFYYKDELTQDEIAKRLSVSRASVGRMLDRARRVGLVTINLNADHLNAFEVSRQLRATFGLAEALVVPDHQAEHGDHQALNTRLGLGGAQFMSTHLRPAGTLGVGWGETVRRVTAATSGGAAAPACAPNPSPSFPPPGAGWSGCRSTTAGSASSSPTWPRSRRWSGWP